MSADQPVTVATESFNGAAVSVSRQAGQGAYVTFIRPDGKVTEIALPENAAVWLAAALQGQA